MSRFCPFPTVLALFVVVAMGTARADSFVVALLADPPAPGDQGLMAAEARVRDMLYQPGAVTPRRPWYRFGIDTMTLIESGPGPRSTEGTSAALGHWSLVDADYARFVTRTRIKLRKNRFTQLFQPQPRPHQIDLGNLLASSADEWLGAGPIHLITLRQVGANSPSTPALVRARFDIAKRRYWISSLLSEPIGSRYVVEAADVHTDGMADSSSTPVVGGRSLWTRIRDFLGLLFRLTADLLVLAIFGFALRWAWIQRFRARPFGLWIPGFASAFTLPALSQETESSFRARLPRYSGEPAAHIELPSMTIRILFYSRAKLQWDPRLRVDTLDPTITECSMLRLPRFVRFVWVERPAEDGNLSLSLVRPRMLGGNDRIDIAVIFFAVPRSSTES